MRCLTQVQMRGRANGRHFLSVCKHLALVCASASAFAMGGAAQAAVTISSGATQGMICAGGICSPTATDANLNVTDLENDLASGNLTVTTTGSACMRTDIDVTAGVTWANSGVLSLVAYHSIAVGQPIAVNGAGGLGIVTNNGGSGGIFSFGRGANVSFLDLASALTINGAGYTLENSVATLAHAIKATSACNYALANNFDASKDGTYSHSPIKVAFSGDFEGLGNTISNLSVSGGGNRRGVSIALFAQLSGGQPGGKIENINLQNVNIGGNGFEAAGLVGLSGGTIQGSFVSGSVSSNYYHNGGPLLGLLVGDSGGTITLSGAVGMVTARKSLGAGGLAGGNDGQISQSYANCTLSGRGGPSDLGGLVSINYGEIVQSYAMGTVKGGGASYDGGLVSFNHPEGTITQVYSTATVSRFSGGYRGGMIGADYSPNGSNSSDYWDLSTSDVTRPSKRSRKRQERSRYHGPHDDTASIRSSCRLRSHDLGAKSGHQRWLSLPDRQSAAKLSRQTE